jgi:hypothetical protein
MIENATMKVIPNINMSAAINILSASSSKPEAILTFVDLRDKKEKRLHAIKRMQAMPVISSILVTLEYLDILSDVSTTRQNPSRLEEVFRMCWGCRFGIV